MTHVYGRTCYGAWLIDSCEVSSGTGLCSNTQLQKKQGSTLIKRVCCFIITLSGAVKLFSEVLLELGSFDYQQLSDCDVLKDLSNLITHCARFDFILLAK